MRVHCSVPIARSITSSKRFYAIPKLVAPALQVTPKLQAFLRSPTNTVLGGLNFSRKASSQTVAAPQAKTSNSSNGNDPAIPAYSPSMSDNASPNAWQQPGAAAYDFRSDVVTSPTATMLSAIASTTLLDDVFLEDPTTTSLETHLANLTNHEAALFVLSGTMGNQIALRAHLTQPPHAVLCDHRAHILEWEAGGVASLSGALVKGVIPRNGTYLTLEDIKENVVLSDDVHACPTKVISLENTLGGTIMPLNETKRISSFAKENDIKLHLDGARLWEAVVAGAGSLPAYTSLFDSVSLCFSKGLGAPIGSMLVSNTSFIKQARWIRKSIGGGLRQAGVVTAAARVAVDETFGKGPNGEGGLLGRSQENARRIAERWERLGGRLSQRTETNMVWLDLEGAGVGGKEFVIRGEEVGLRFMGGRLVVHYQISEDAIERLDKLMTKLLSSTKSHSLPSNGGKELKEAAERNMNIEVE